MEVQPFKIFTISDTLMFGTIVEDIKFILRGYEDFAEKLQSLGGEIKLIRDERELQKSRMMIG